MTTDGIRDVVIAILRGIAPETDPAAIPPDEDLRDALDIDSMDFLRFAIEIEARLGVTVPEADYPSIRTLAGCSAYLAERRAGGGPAAADRR